MTTPNFKDSDLETFAKFMGFEGIDSDLFYESYYNICQEYEQYEGEWEYAAESIETI